MRETARTGTGRAGEDNPMTTPNAAAIWNAALQESATLRAAALAHDAGTLRPVTCEGEPTPALFEGDPITETVTFLRMLADALEKGRTP